MRIIIKCSFKLDLDVQQQPGMREIRNRTQEEGTSRTYLTALTTALALVALFVCVWGLPKPALLAERMTIAGFMLMVAIHLLPVLDRLLRRLVSRLANWR